MTDRNCTCLFCNTQFKPKNKKNPSKFCAMACYRAYQKTPAYTTDYKRPSKRKIHIQPKPCSNCGEAVVRRPSTKRNGVDSDKVYCNRKCYNDHRTSIHQEVIGSCKCCGADITKQMKRQGENTYCSMACRNKDVRPDPRPCGQCGVVFDPIKYYKAEDRYVWNDSAKMCSDDCVREFYRTDESRKEKISAAFKGSKHPNWQGGVSHFSRSYRGSEWQKLRKAAMKRDGYKCCHCGIDHDEQIKRHNRSFSINHIVPFFQADTTGKANKLSNLETLCDSCHTKADWAYRKNNPMQGVLNFGRDFRYG